MRLHRIALILGQRPTVRYLARYVRDHWPRKAKLTSDIRASLVATILDGGVHLARLRVRELGLPAPLARVLMRKMAAVALMQDKLLNPVIVSLALVVNHLSWSEAPLEMGLHHKYVLFDISDSIRPVMARHVDVDVSAHNAPSAAPVRGSLHFEHPSPCMAPHGHAELAELVPNGHRRASVERPDFIGSHVLFDVVPDENFRRYWNSFSHARILANRKAVRETQIGILSTGGKS